GSPSSTALMSLGSLFLASATLTFMVLMIAICDGYVKETQETTRGRNFDSRCISYHGGFGPYELAWFSIEVGLYREAEAYLLKALRELHYRLASSYAFLSARHANHADPSCSKQEQAARFGYCQRCRANRKRDLWTLFR